MKKITWNLWQRFKPIVFNFLLFVFFGLFFHSKLNAQTCCLTSSLNVSTGWDPSTGSALGFGAVDPHWTTCGVSAAAAADITASGFTTGVNAYTIDYIHGFWWPNGAFSTWISCIPANSFAVTGSGDDFTLCRDFNVCSPNSENIDFNLSVAGDNWVDVYIDASSTPVFSHTSHTATGNYSALTPIPPFMLLLTPGTHTIKITAHEDNVLFNPAGVNLQGSITSHSSSNVLKREDGSCNSWTYCTPSSIIGVHPLCVGEVIPFSYPEPGGTWSSSNTAVAQITATGTTWSGGSSGTITAIAAGTATITYTDPCGRPVLYNVTVSAPPLPITGPIFTECAFNTLHLSDASTGGSWSSSPTTIATVNTTGDVYGVAGGTATISYTISGCPPATATVTINQPAAITGPTIVCVGSQITLSDASAPGTWISSNPPVATIGLTSGIVTGVKTGTSTISYTETSTGCSAITTVTVILSPDPILGPGSVCVGSTISLTDGTPGGIWSSSLTGIATVGAAGDVNGITPGITAISYSLLGCPPAAVAVTVNPSPAAIVGPTSVCGGLSITLGDPTTGGTWSSVTPAIASIDASGHVIGGLVTTPTTAIISYTLPPNCAVTTTITVNPTPVITAPAAPCVGSLLPLTFTSSISGGTWYSTNTAIASIDPHTGVATLGGSAGSVTIDYVLPTGCWTSVLFYVKPLPVITLTSTPPISLGTPNIIYACPTATITATPDIPSSLVWSTGSTSTSIIVTPPVTTTYNVTATSLDGCVSTASVDVIPVTNSCLCTYISGGMPFSPFAPTSAGGTITTGSAASYSHGNFYMNNNVYITGAPGSVVTLTNSIILIDPNLVIFVDPGVRLVLDHCHLFTCTQSWAGIVLQSGSSGVQGQIELKNNTLIEDADVAILAQNPVTPTGYAPGLPGPLIINSHGATFNRCNESIKIINYSDNIAPLLTGGLFPEDRTSCYPFVIENTVFTSRDFSNFIPFPLTTWAIGTSWPFFWPGTTGPRGLKTPWTPATPYDPPYNIDNPMACPTGGYPPAPIPIGSGGPAWHGIFLAGVGYTSGGSTSTAGYSSIVVGSIPTTSADELNLFDNMQFGITGGGSNLTVRNSAFMHMIQTTTYAGSGDGINLGSAGQLYVYGSDGSTRGSTATSCSFYDCINDVEATDFYNTKVEFANFYSKHSSAFLSDPMGKNAILVKSSDYYDVQLNYNNIYNITNGISFEATPTTGSMGQITIDYNTIQATIVPGATTTISNEYTTQGISVKCTSPSPGTAVATSQIRVDNNTLDQVFNGINITGFNSPNQMVTTDINTITMLQDLVTGAASSAPQTGILHRQLNPSVSVSAQGFIQGNTITGPGHNNPAPPFGASYGAPIMEAIHTDNVQYEEVGCNLAQYINTGFFFDGTCFYFKWENNTMNTNAYGYVISGIIAGQGTPAVACGNQWLPGSGFWGTLGTYPYQYPYQTYTKNYPNLSMLWVNSGMIPSFNGQDVMSIPAYSIGSTLISTSALPASSCSTVPAPVILLKQANNDSTKGIQNSNAQSYTLFPNPSDGNVVLQQLITDTDPVSATVWNAAGQKVYDGKLNFEGGIARFNMSDKVPGLYMMQLIDKKGSRFTLRFTIE